MINIIISATSEALLWSIMAIGVYLMYRILDIADLSAEGVFPLGASVCAILIISGTHPLIATVAALIAGSLAGLVTSLLHTKLKIPALLAGILTMTGLYSINLRVMGRSNINLAQSETLVNIVKDFVSKDYAALVIGVVALIIVITALYLFYKTEIGLAFIATGDNEAMSQANSINTDNMKILGYMISNGLIALSGALLCQFNGFADTSSGVGTIVIGLAAVIIAGVIVRNARFVLRLLTVVMGAILYRLIISIVLEFRIEASDLKLFSAIILTLFLYIPNIKLNKKSKKIKEV